jgi:type II secretory pathway pseudopilin PulG
MTPDANTIATLVGTIATGGLAAWAARSAKRTKRQENRDDFTEIKKALKEQAAELKADLAVQQDQINGQGAAISWLVIDRRSLVATIRNAKLKPPVPRPIPDRARPYLDHIDL